jgi:hypothetical protein
VFPAALSHARYCTGNWGDKKEKDTVFAHCLQRQDIKMQIYHLREATRE